jgi:hypothetical protein
MSARTDTLPARAESKYRRGGTKDHREEAKYRRGGTKDRGNEDSGCGSFGTTLWSVTPPLQKCGLPFVSGGYAPRFVLPHNARLGTRLLARLYRGSHLRLVNSMRFQGASRTDPGVRNYRTGARVRVAIYVHLRIGK